MIRTKKHILNLICITIFFSIKIVQANSPQIPDYLIFKNDTIPVYSLILENYFTQQKNLNNKSLADLNFRDISSTNCWRGYQAVYEIHNDSLFLKNIISCGELSISKPIDQVESLRKMQVIFPERLVNNKVFIDWFTGEFSLPIGKLLRWDGVFHKTFEEEILFKVENGIVQKISKIQNYIDDVNRKNRRYNDTISNIIFRELKKNYEQENKPPDCSERFTATIDKKGQISKITMTDYSPKEIKEYFDPGEYEKCVRTIRKYLKDLKFDIIKDQGKPVEEKITFEIWLNDDGSLENWTY